MDGLDTFPSSFSWPVSRLGEALEALASRSGLSPRMAEIPIPPQESTTDGGLGGWIEAAAAHLGLEAEPIEIPYGEVERLVRDSGPALLRLPDEEGKGARFLALLGGGQWRVPVLGLDQAVHRLRPEVIRAALCREVEAPLTAEVDRLLEEAGVSGRRRARVRAAILRERLGLARIGGGWLVRLPPGASVYRHARVAHLVRRLFAFLAAYALQYLLWLLAWWVVGSGALEERLDWGWLLAWALLLLALVPLQMLANWSQGSLAIGAGKVIKRRLLYGALRFEPDEIRHQGVGQLLGRVLESEAVERLALSGGFLALVAGIELVMATAVLAAGAGGGFHVLLLVGWVAITLLIAWRYYRLHGGWTTARLWMTHDLVERMVGHQTRLAQQSPDRWHDGEDQALARYLVQSKALDRTASWLMVLVSRGWLAVGVLGLAPSFVSGGGSTAALAVGLGGVLSGYLALRKLVGGLLHLLTAAVAWRQVAPIFHAAARPEVIGSPAFVATPSGDRSGKESQPALDARELVFRYRDRGEPVLQKCSLRVQAGERLLLEGPSGSGKSTLVALLTGLRVPESGLLLAHGLDRQTMGPEDWRRQVVGAPQFHENYVFTETFAFNLLMGRGWPPRWEDMEEAETICRELGLGDLIDRMPAGLLQMVGESGWQLSHGERSRLYIARALLQEADTIVLDESFAALDPESLQRALRCVLDRAPTLLVIAHP